VNGGDIAAEVLRREGTAQVFCFPSNYLLEPVAEAGIRPIMARVERVVINMADGFTRTNNARQIGTVLTQGGPGVENAFGGIAQAYADATPLLFLPGGAARARVSLPSTFDAVSNYQHITRWADRFVSARRISDQLRRAYTYLRGGRPGPVLLELPSDVLREDADADTVAYEAVRPIQNAGAPQDVKRAARLLLEAEHPLLHAGQEVLYAEATPELVELAELVQAPVMTTLTGKSAMPENHPLAVGMGAVSVSPPLLHFLHTCDLLFSVGSDLARTLGSVSIPPGGKVVQCTADDRALGAEYALTAGVYGNARLVLRQLIEEVQHQLGLEGRRGDHAVADTIAALKARARDEWLPKLTADDTPINPYRVVYELDRSVDKAHTIVTHDSGYPRDQLAWFYEATTPRGYLGWGNTTPLGSSLGLAMGARLAAPEKLVVNVIGDTGFGQCGMDIETATRENLPILTIILNNLGMAGYNRKLPITQRNFPFNRMGGDYCGVARALGAYAERVEDPGAIGAALARARSAITGGQTAVLEMMTVPDTSYPRIREMED
jgi:acetolactate synthase-1/2/3 large subunit